ncbi:MAG: HAMP domain-containing sensor histidine kinase [Thiohalobacteraceae bacterium]
MSGRLWRWVNSLQAHMILLALSTLAAITAFSVAAINLTGGPPASPVSVYEMTRIVRGMELVQNPPKSITPGQADDAPTLDGTAERLISTLLADRLALPHENVRVDLEYDSLRADDIANEARLYGDEGAANPAVIGSFTIFVRQPDRTWKTFRRTVDHWQARSLRFWRYATYYLGIMVVLPLAMLLSLRISRPVRMFAAAADRIGAGLDDTPVPVIGPTEIRQAAVALNEMQARIAQFVRERTALVGAIAHDLRTPLSNLRFRIANADPETRASVEEELRRMEQLINSTLHYVDGEGRPMMPEPLDLGSLLATITDEYSDRGAQVALTAGERITVRGDLIRLRRLFTNLIENGLQFGQHVEVAYRRDGDDAVIDIVDDGPGMASEHLPRAFDPFFRGEPSRNRSTGGIGLGLAIAASAAQAHHGSIMLRNLDGGFRARVRLPLNGPVRPGEAAPEVLAEA